MKTIVLPLINFSILVVILFCFLRKPLRVFVEERHRSLSNRLREAQKLLAEAEAQKRDLDQKLKNLENEKKELRLRLRSDVESAIKSAIAKAERLSRSAIEDANARSRQLIEDFKREMIVETGRRVVLRAESIIRQRITEQDSSRLREQLSKEIVGG